MERTQVLIAGGGPVGMTLAADLARRGVRCILVEQNDSTTAHPKMDITNARSMELFQSAGLAEKLRKVAVPEDHCFDVSWITRFTGKELYRFKYPSVTEYRRLIRSKNDGSQPAEPPMRVSQVEVEKVLYAHIKSQSLIDTRFGTQFEDFVQDQDGVEVTIRSQSTGVTSVVHCDYLIGCDGGSSRVRKSLGIGLSGEARTMQRYMVHFRSTRKDLLMRWGHAWHYQSSLGTLISQNDRDVWTLHSRIPKDMPLEAINPSELITQFVGEEIDHEVLVANQWVPHLLVADSYGKARVLLAGDSAHQYIPTGGYGMNTGVAEAFDLGWKLAATLDGFGGPALLESYEIERRPVALRNCAASRRHNDIRIKIAELYTPEVFSDAIENSQQGEVASRKIQELGNAENESLGIELGYCYSDSPIVLHESESMWTDDPIRYVPLTTPGCRLPNIFLKDGSSLFDQLGPWFSILVMTSTSTESFEAAAADIGVPLKIIFIDESDRVSLYQAEAILVRPDQHVAWRGAAMQTKTDAFAILARSLGWPTIDGHPGVSPEPTTTSV